MKLRWPLPVFGLFAAGTVEALAHASDRGFVLLLPTGYYLTGGAIAVAASFMALAVLPPNLLDRLALRRIPLFRIGLGARVPVSLASFMFMAVLVAAGFLGSRDPLSNPLPLTVWTLLWIGLTLAQGLLGNLWAWINPWYGPVWLIGRLARIRGEFENPSFGRLRLPDAAGYWPAAFLFFGFAWFELIYPAPDDPARLAWTVAVYWAFNFACMLLFGYSAWSARGECLSVFFGMVARLSVFELARPPRRSRRARLNLRWPAAKLRAVAALPLSGTLFLLLALASVSFDGFSRTFFWLGANGINPLEFPGRSALIATNTAGLLLTFAVLSVAFLLAVHAGNRLAGGAGGLFPAAGLLVWSIVPIALAYHFSHYLTALVVNAQYAAVALSDPFSRGWNLFGTAYMPVMPGVVAGAASAKVLWNLQAGAIIAGHVLAVLIAHLLAERLHPEPRAAALSQAPLTVLMIAYTVFGLWLLSTPTAS